MNVLDFVIIIVLGSYLLYRQRVSLAYHICFSLLVLAGFVAGVFIAVHSLRGLAAGFNKGALELLVIAAGTTLGAFSGARLGGRLYISVLTSRLSTADRWLAMAYKPVACLCAVVLLSQTLLYIPIVRLQFVAQGSSFLYATDKLLPETLLAGTLRQASAGQFVGNTLPYNEVPINDDNIKQSGEIQPVIDRLAPSVVRVSGSSCVGTGSGSGVVVAPHIIVTAAHVTNGASNIYVRDHSGAYPATPILIDYKKDVAFLYAAFINEPPVPLTKFEAAVDSPVYIMGYPGAGNLTLTQGAVLPGVAQTENIQLDDDEMTLTNAASSPGNSGGPAFNQQGEIIGIVSGGGRGDTLLVSSTIVSELLATATKKLIPTRTEFCGVGKKYL